MVLDEKLINLADRAASHLQEEWDIGLPAILREATLGTMVSFLALLLTSFADGHITAGTFLLLPILYSIAQLYDWFKRFARDAEQAWSHKISSRYVMEAQTQRITYRYARIIFLFGFILATGSFIYNAFNGAPPTIYRVCHSLSMLLLTTLFYLRCALPKPPGRRRVKQLIPALSKPAA